MDDLSREAKNLIAAVGNADGPTVQDRERVKRQLLVAAASGVAAVTATLSKSAAAGNTALLDATTLGSGAVNGVGLASTAPAAAAASVAGAGAGGTLVTAAASTGLAAAKVSTATTLLGLSKAAWLAGACIAGAGLTGTFVAQNAAETSQASHEVNPQSSALAANKPVANKPLANKPLVNAPSAAQLAAPPIATPELEASSGRQENTVTPAVAAASALLAPAVAARPRTRADVAPLKSVGNAQTQATETRTESVASELSLLTEAQRALAGGTPKQALFLAEQHATQFPNSALRTERAALRVFALCRLGRVEEARRAGRTFLRDGQNSPLAPRVLESCISSTPSASDSKTE
jgi:hypothetical protein